MFIRLISIVLVGLAVFGCSSQPPAVDPEPASSAPPAGAGRSARTLDIPGAGPAQGGPSTGSGEHTVGLRWEDPEGWVSVTPSSSMRLAQYRVPGPGGDAECVVYYFGPGQGGDPTSNAVRWAGQFSQPDGRSSVDLMKLTPLTGTPFPTQIAAVTGTYDGGMTMTDAPAEEQSSYMLLGGIVEGPDAPWFFKFTGPEATIRAQSKAFEELMRSLHAGH